MLLYGSQSAFCTAEWEQSGAPGQVPASPRVEHGALIKPPHTGSRHW